MRFRAFRYTLVAALAAGACCTAAVTTQTIVGAPVPSTSLYKQPVVIGGFVQNSPAAPGVPTGSVNLLENGTLVTSTTLDSKGNFSFTFDTLPVGRHNLTVLYIPSGNFVTSTSPVILQIVNAAPTTTTLTVPSQSAQVNQVITFSAAVVHTAPSSGVPAGTVAFYDGSTQIGTAALPFNGPAVLSKALPLGLHSVTAVFTPSNGNAIASTSPALALSVGANVTIALASNPPSPPVSETAMLVATVSGTGTTPNGTVQFQDGPLNLGQAILSAGQGSIPAVFNTVGAHTIAVNYSGDSVYLPGTANFSITVSKVSSTVSLNAGSTSVSFGQSVTLTAQVGPQLASVGAPSGQVTFFDGSTPVGNVTPSSGFALLTLSNLNAGKHVLAAYYVGDANWQPAQSPPVVVTVDLATTLTSITLVKSFPQQVTVAAQVTVLPPSSGNPSGSVQFVDSITHVVLGTSPLTAGTAGATINLQGANPVAALYVGDGNYASSTSIPTSVLFLINAAGTVAPALAPDELIAIFGSNLARQVVPAPGLPLPTDLGSVVIDIVDANSVTRRASLSYVSPGQVNALLPNGTAYGPATLNVTTAYGMVFPVQVTITPTAPGIFTANSDGRGVAAATVLRVKADGTQVTENAITFDGINRKWLPVPIDVSNASESVYLLLYGTGIRNIADSSAVSCLLNNTPIKPAYAGAQPSFPGLDQVNILLPSSMAGAGQVTMQLTVNGQPANPVTFAIK